ncbi:MAG TPA: nucleotidyltransferase domain-containing protein [Ignavibacteria bacterium]|nr:nucleotidyltransferase domain-containing protein [Ignavibacteria bacterium]
MDKSEALKIANEFAFVVKNKFDCISVILFGSYAQEKNKEESDIDIAVVMKDFSNSTNIQLELMRLRRKIDSRIEPHPFRVIDFNKTNPLASEILKYGIELL